MNEHVIYQIPLYLDNELQGDEQRLFEAHINACASCWAALEYERRLILAIHQARPLYSTPEGLREKIEQILQNHQPISKRFSSRTRRVFVAIVVVLGLILAWFIARPTHIPLVRPSEFALVAVDTHQRYTRNQLPLEVISSSPEEISTWFAGKLPFNLKLPNYPEDLNQSKPYEIVGARLIGFKQDYAAHVVYRLHNRPISLVVTSETIAQPAGGEKIPWQGLLFHFDVINGWKVLTWSDKGLTYALVSDFEEHGQASCVVCHSGGQDQHKFEGLKFR
ncbi:MAG TPA: zf-HC2 domain-containing protein [Candidatus Limnocylindrales bacterium]|nr:zf-HC2 domain-containing protein [Candidatus Limnocylindrales bacterium]